MCAHACFEELKKDGWIRRMNIWTSYGQEKNIVECFPVLLGQLFQTSEDLLLLILAIAAGVLNISPYKGGARRFTNIVLTIIDFFLNSNTYLII